MAKQMTEMLKGTLEGIVLALLAVRPAYGYEITARLRERGFADIVEGTVYALLVRIEQRGFAGRFCPKLGHMRHPQHHITFRGSSASRSPSPMKLMASTVRKMAAPANSAQCGAISR